MSVTIAICDDDYPQIKYIRKLLLEWGGNQPFALVISEYESAEEFLFHYESDSCDLLLLDIEMKGMNGMELARGMRAKGDMLPILFITGYHEYMNEGYDVEALHYLLKPIVKEKLFDVLNRYVQKQSHTKSAILVKTEGQMIRIESESILYCEALGHKTGLYLQDGSCILADISIIVLTVVVLFLRKYLYLLIDRRIERFQSELIEKQVNEIQNMYKQMRGWRHDYRNHIQNMKIQIHDQNYHELNAYLDQLSNDLNTVDTVIKTGYVMADAVLNSKLTVAEKAHVNIHVKANIPECIPLTDVELCAMLGNLLGNATESCMKLPKEERFMRVYIGSLKKTIICIHSKCIR